MKTKILSLLDFKKADIEKLIDRAVALKKGKSARAVLKGGSVGLIFEKESTRTRISFEVAVTRLGGHAVYVGQNTSQLSRGESYADTARVLSGYLGAMVIRGRSHADLEEMARHADIPVINGLTDLYHPCQLLADLMTIREKRGDIENLHIAYVGDGNNMANTWIEAGLVFPFKLVLACPDGYRPHAMLLEKISGHPRICISGNPTVAVEGCDVINTDTWFSMGHEVSEAKRKAFDGFQVNGNLLKKAKKNVIVLHCLPAHRGEEITDDVIDGPHSAVFDQAENRLYVQMALLEALFG